MKTKILLAAVLTVAAVAILWAQNKGNKSPELPDEVKEWEQLAEQVDTVALHKLLVFFDNNAPVYVEVEEVIEVGDESVDFIVSYGDIINNIRIDSHLDWNIHCDFSHFSGVV